MIEFEQIPFGTSNFADNPEPRCPCLLLLDNSVSMSGNHIQELNKGLIVYKDELAADTLAMKRVETAIISFGPVKTQTEFCTAENFTPPTLSPEGVTPMGEAIMRGIDMIKDRKEEYRKNGISFYRPWIFLITDGSPSDDWELAAKMVKEGEASKAFAFFAVGVQDANMTILSKISERDPIKLQGLKFRELFLWLSNSMKSVSHSTPNDIVPLASPSGWSEV